MADGIPTEHDSERAGAVVLRKKSSRDRFQVVVMVQATETRASHNAMGRWQLMPGQHRTSCRPVGKSKGQALNAVCG
jgi:hypothetical protein